MRGEIKGFFIIKQIKKPRLYGAFLVSKFKLPIQTFDPSIQIWNCLVQTFDPSISTFNPSVQIWNGSIQAYDPSIQI